MTPSRRREDRGQGAGHYADHLGLLRRSSGVALFMLAGAGYLRLIQEQFDEHRAHLQRVGHGQEGLGRARAGRGQNQPVNLPVGPNGLDGWALGLDNRELAVDTHAKHELPALELARLQGGGPATVDAFSR